MPRSSRHKSHKQSKHSSKEYSDSEGEDVKMKESGLGRIAKDSGHLASGEKRKLASQLKEGKEGKDLYGHGNGDAIEDYVSSKRRKEKTEDASGGGDMWNSGGDERGESGALDKENRGESSKNNGEKGPKTRETKGESKGRTSKRHEGGGERKEENLGSVVVEKEESKSVSRSELKRKSEKEKEGKESKELRERDRVLEREKKGQESKRGEEVYVDGDVTRKQGMQSDDFVEDRQGKSSRNAVFLLQDDLQNPDNDKEHEKSTRKREGNGDVYQDDCRDGDGRRMLSRGDGGKEGICRDEKHKEEYRLDKYPEDGDRDERYRNLKYREDSDSDNKHRDDKYQDDGNRDARHRDDKYQDDGDRDSRKRADKYRDRHRDYKHREDGERESRRRDDKYREDGERANRRKDEKYREDVDKESRRSDVRNYEDGDRDGRHKDEKYREDGDRDNRHKEEKYQDEYGRENRHRDGKHGDDVDRENRFRETKYRDDHVLKDRSSDKSDVKRSRDEIRAADFHSRKSNLHDDSAGYDDRMTRYKDDQGKRKASEKEDQNDIRSRSTKDQFTDSEKRSAGSGRVELVSDRGRSTSRNADLDVATHIRRRSSPSSGSYFARDQYRLSKQDDSKYRDYAYEERSRHIVTSSREYAGVSEKKALLKDDGHFSELATERHLRSDTRTSPLLLIYKSVSSTSTKCRNLIRSDVRRGVDVGESGKRIGGSKEGKSYSGREGRGGRDVPLETFPADELSQADGDNLSISSPFTRTNHLSSSSKSLLPLPPFRSGVDSPLPFGASEDDSRNKSNSRHRRFGDHTMGRVQGNSWRGIPNWPSPVANGFMPFQHGPPPVGFHPVMQQFPTPQIFGVRPSMELNHPGVPFHIPDADRFSGHVRPMGWRNSVDDSGPPALHGWDGNNVVFGEDSHIFGRTDWENGRSLPGVRSWEPSGDMWKGPNSGATAGLPSLSTQENSLSHGGEDEFLAGQSGQQAQHGKGQSASQIETSLPRDASELKIDDTLKFIPKETPLGDEKSKSDDVLLCRAYLSKLDISANLTEPEQYVQGTGLLEMDHNLICDVDVSKILYMEEAVEAGATTVNKVPSTLLFPTTNETVFQKAMFLYKKHKEEFKVTRQDSPAPSIMQNESVQKSSLDKDLEDGIAQEEVLVDVIADVTAVENNEKEQENLLPVVSKEVDLPNSLENLGACVIAKNGASADVVEKSEDLSLTTGNTSMEVRVTSDLEAKDRIIEDDPVSVETVGQAIDRSPNVDELVSPSVAGSDLSAINNESKEVVDSKCGPLLLSDVHPEACEAVMPEPIESGSVNLSRIHHSPESTH